MPFDLDALTVDPTQRRNIMQESNTSIVNYAKSAQAQLDELQLTNRELREIEASEFMVDKIADQQAATNILSMVDATNSTLSGLDASIYTLEQVMATSTARLSDLQVLLSAPNDLSPQDLKQAKKEFDQLDRQAYKTNQTLLAARQQRAAIQNSSAQAIELFANRHSISKQARDNNEQVARSMTLKNRLQAIDDAIKSDGELLKLITSRQKMEAGEAAQASIDASDYYESMYFFTHQGENMDMYGVQQARDMQEIDRRLSDVERRGLALVASEYIRSKYAGVPLNVGHYKELLAERGETAALKVVAKLSGDRDLEDTIAMGETELYNRLYQQATAQALASMPEAERVMGLSDQKLREISQSVQRQVADTNAREVLPAALEAVSRDVTNNVNLRGQEVLSSVAEGGEELLSPLLFSPQVREYFASDEAKQIMTTPNVANGAPLLDTVDQLVRSMQRNGFSGEEAIFATSNLLSQAAKASYKTRKDFGSNRYSTALQTLERVGYATNPKIMLPVPQTRNIPASRAGVAGWDASNPVDLQAALAYLNKFKVSRQNIPAAQPDPTTAFRGIARGAPIAPIGTNIPQQ